MDYFTFCGVSTNGGLPMICATKPGRAEVMPSKKATMSAGKISA